MPTFAETQAGYTNMWAKCVVRPEKVTASDALAAKIVSHKSRYQAVEKVAEIPWFVIGCIHYREADFDFTTFLGNGQPLNRVTTEVPAGLGPWDSWEAGAIEALKKYRRPLPWGVALCLYTTEDLNGWGYVAKNVNSPYVWSWTNLYASGKYVADHDFSSSEIDVQCGCAAILKSLEKSGAISFQEAQMPTTPAAIPTVTVVHPTTGQQFVLPQMNIAQIEGALKTVSNILPIVATFFPALSPFLPVVPIAEGLVQAVGDIQAGGSIPTVIVAQLRAIANQIEASFPPPVASPTPPA